MLFIYMVLLLHFLLPDVDEAAVTAAELYCLVHVIVAAVGAAANVRWSIRIVLSQVPHFRRPQLHRVSLELGTTYI